MKKFFIVLGSIFLALIVLGAIGVVFVAARGNALDKESKAYADAAIPAIVTTWLDKALLERASPEFNQATSAVQVYHMFRSWESSLGRLQKCEPAQGQSRQRKRLLCLANGHYRSTLDVYRLATIQCQKHRIVGIACFDLNCRSLGDNDRSICQDMWANRCDHENSRLRIKDRAAGRQRVSCRTCRRCNNQAVRIELSEWFAIDSRAQQHQARKFAAA